MGRSSPPGPDGPDAPGEPLSLARLQAQMVRELAAAARNAAVIDDAVGRLVLPDQPELRGALQACDRLRQSLACLVQVAEVVCAALPPTAMVNARPVLDTLPLRDLARRLGEAGGTPFRGAPAVEGKACPPATTPGAAEFF